MIIESCILYSAIPAHMYDIWSPTNSEPQTNKTSSPEGELARTKDKARPRGSLRLAFTLMGGGGGGAM